MTNMEYNNFWNLVEDIRDALILCYAFHALNLFHYRFQVHFWITFWTRKTTAVFSTMKYVFVESLLFKRWCFKSYILHMSLD